VFLVDGNGGNLGRLLSFSGNTVEYRDGDGLVWQALADTGAIGSGGFILFSGSGCSGAAYVGPTFVNRVFATPSTIYKAVLPLATVSISSELIGPTCNNHGPVDTLVMVAQPIASPSPSPFPLPFSLQ
jgi:hypothetical protein